MEEEDRYLVREGNYSVGGQNTQWESVIRCRRGEYLVRCILSGRGEYLVGMGEQLGDCLCHSVFLLSYKCDRQAGQCHICTHTHDARMHERTRTRTHRHTHTHTQTHTDTHTDTDARARAHTRTHTHTTGYIDKNFSNA